MPPVIPFASIPYRLLLRPLPRPISNHIPITPIPKRPMSWPHHGRNRSRISHNRSIIQLLTRDPLAHLIHPFLLRAFPVSFYCGSVAVLVHVAVKAGVVLGMWFNVRA
ncbi:hypothetical protein EJ08DRAFT_253668 [Tothia fuscella]|uniref:Uncharacterized protein n=1 Tax=Tothia fuscella TaxID=1048955 RepID=A0A9P4NRM3_9PEZI|nr:hypothetical protein EJ08DRAFT_253668 [Tothia fuscella]